MIFAGPPRTAKVRVHGLVAVEETLFHPCVLSASREMRASRPHLRCPPCGATCTAECFNALVQAQRQDCGQRGPSHASLPFLGKGDQQGTFHIGSIPGYEGGAWMLR